MTKLRILIPLHTTPNNKSFLTIFFENLLPVLKKHADVDVTWLVYTPERLDNNQTFSNDTILDIHDYENALEVVKKVCPDIIYSSETWNFIDYALSSVAKDMNIPVFCIVYSNIFLTKTTTQNILSNFKRFFQNSVPTDTDQNEKQFMRRGRFFIYKYRFLLKTMFAIKKRRFETLTLIWKFILFDRLNPKFAPDTIQFLENEGLVKERLNLGFSKSNLIVTGNPIYDDAFHKLTNHTNSNSKSDKIRVLFAPSTLYEHGFWSSEQREYAVKETVKKITEQKNTMSLTIKIHPSSSVLSDYESMIHAIDPTIQVHQKGGIQDFLQNTDVVITFQSSTAEVYALMANKPVIICNYYNIKGDVFLDRKLAANCKNPSLLIQSIHQAVSESPIQNSRDDFIREFMYKWDGRASERISNYIMELFKKEK